jgi:hypothetical protein
VVRTATNNLAQLVRMFASAQAKVPADGDAATAVGREVRPADADDDDADDVDADEETRPATVEGEVPDAVDDVGADEEAAPQVTDAEVDDDMEDFLT